MKFHEAIKELLDGKTICRMNFDPYYNETLLDEITFDGVRVGLQKSRITVGRDGKRCKKEVYSSANCSEIKFYPEELVADDWFVKDESCSSEEAFIAFCEGKWIKHKTRDSFVRRDPFDPDTCYRCYVHPASAGRTVYKEFLRLEELQNLFLFKDNWLVCDYSEDECEDEHKKGLEQ